MSLIGGFARITLAAAAWYLCLFALYVALDGGEWVQQMLGGSPPEAMEKLAPPALAAIAYIAAVAGSRVSYHMWRGCRDRFTAWYVLALGSDETKASPSDAPWRRKWDLRDVAGALAAAYPEPWPGCPVTHMPNGRFRDAYVRFAARTLSKKGVGASEPREIYNRARDLMLESGGSGLIGHYTYCYHLRSVAEQCSLPLFLAAWTGWAWRSYDGWAAPGLLHLLLVGLVLVLASVLWQCTCTGVWAPELPNQPTKLRRCMRLAALGGVPLVPVACGIAASLIAGDDLTPASIGTLLVPLAAWVVVWLCAGEARARYKWMIDTVARHAIMWHREQVRDGKLPDPACTQEAP